MDCLRFNKTLFLIGTLSCLLLSTTTAVPSTHVFGNKPENSGIISHLPIRTVIDFKPQVEQLCAGAENPSLCVETIAPYLTGSFNPVTALESEIKATMQTASKVAGEISKMLDDPATAKNAMDALGICKSQYNDMLDSIKEALDLVAKMNFVEAQSKLSAVISYKSACEDSFAESPGVVMPFAQDSTALFQLGGNCLAIMDTIVKSSKL